MKKFAIYTILLGAGLVFFGKGFLAAGQDNFWTEAAQSGMAEVMMGNLALQKAQSEEVKRFAQMMVDDHTATNNELKQIAAGKNVTLPADVDNRHRSAMNKLNRLSGTQFDREYMKNQVKEHERAVKLFQRQAERGSDADAKAFAAKNLPALQSHLQMARTISDNLKNNNRGGNRNTNMMNSNTGGNSEMNMNADRNMNSNTRNMNANTNRNRNSNQNTNSNRNTNTNVNSNNL